MTDSQLPQGLLAFLAVADTASFTAAAARLGISPSAVSQQVRALERAVDTALLHRTTRSVRLTEAGKRYREAVRQPVAAIRDAAHVLEGPDAEPRGRLRLTLPRTAFHAVLRPVLPAYVVRYPQVSIELSIDNALVDVVRVGFDAGIRFGDLVEQDMVSVRIGPDLRIAVLASPAYWHARGRPTHPRDLVGHDCIGFRSTTAGTIEAWRFARCGEEIRVPPTGAMAVNSTEMLLAAAEDGLGVIEFVEELAGDALAAGRLEPVLRDWCPTLPGFHLHYPNRLRTSSALRALLAMLRL